MMKSYRIFNHVACITLLIVGLFTSTVSAALIGLTLENSPDIFSSGIDVVYSAGTLTATGWATELDADGDDVDNLAITDTTSSSFALSASIDGSGTLSDGSVTISGKISGLGFNSGTLLTGNITGFGFDETGGEVLEFVFNVTGGDAADLYGDGSIGIIMGFTGFSGGSWGGDFDNCYGFPGEGYGNAVSDTAPVVPEPATLVLLAGGALLLKRRKR
ncbi:MAG: PEP-CTERM sorting domain-containing protein [Phycisphaerae bacterium]|nr:PEP-CTERM sorting domain-containing protein [Phycisphaerae bacterium]